MRGPMPRLSRFVVAFAFVVVFRTATTVWAWGRLGHRAISRIAEKQLTPRAKAAIAELLEPGESLADERDQDNPQRTGQDNR
jgi:hypothetical protein